MTAPQNIIPIILGAWVTGELALRAGQLREAAGRDTLLDLVRQAGRAGGANGVLDPAPILVGTRAQCLEIAARLSPADAGANVIEEPAARGTCFSATLGCLRALERSGDAIVLLATSPCFIPRDALGAAVASAAWDAELDFVVTFGLRPSDASAVRRYITPGSFDYGNTFGVASFRDAVCCEDAARLVAAGSLWSSGLHLSRARTLLNEAAKLCPEVFNAAVYAWQRTSSIGTRWALAGAAYTRCPALTVEEAVIEASPRVTVLPVEATALVPAPASPPAPPFHVIGVGA